MNASELEALVKDLELQLDSFQETKVTPVQYNITQLKNSLAVEEYKLESLRLDYKNLQQKLNVAKVEWTEASKTSELEERLVAIFKRLATFEAKWQGRLRTYQVEDAVSIIDAYELGLNGILNANVMGAGKTSETVAALDYLVSQPEFAVSPAKVLFLTKKSLTRSLAKEIMKWSNFIPLVVEGTAATKASTMQLWTDGLLPKAVVVTNYDSLAGTPELVATTWDFVIADEVQKLKGGASHKPTQIFLNMRKLLGIVQTNADFDTSVYYKPAPKFERQRKTFYIPMSGTPAENRAREIYAVLHLFRPDLFTTVKEFEKVFCGWDGKLSINKLLSSLKGLVIRQDPDKIRSEWPTHTINMVELTMGEQQAKETKRIKQELMLKLASMEQERNIPISVMIALIIRLRQVNTWAPSIKQRDIDPETMEETGLVFTSECNESSKIDEAIELCQGLVDQGENVVVWSAQFNEPLVEVARRLTELGITNRTITGATDNKQAIENSFQQGEFQVLLTTIMTCGEGYNFHKNPGDCDCEDKTVMGVKGDTCALGHTLGWPGGSRYGIFLDLWYNPKKNEQACHRIWRLGTKEPVTNYFLINENSIDQWLLNLLEEKEAEVDGLMEHKSLKASEWIDKLGLDK